MSVSDTDSIPTRVTNESIWRHTGTIFWVALLFFLINILLGFLNALTTGQLPQWQLLTHLHAAALGWITLSVIGLSIWLFTGDRTVSDTYVRRVRLLGWLSIIAFAAYVASFAIGFSRGGDTLMVLPVTGAAAMLMFWGAALFAWTQLRQQSVVTTVHLLLAMAFVVGGLAAIMGVLIGLNYATGGGIATVQAHAPPMLFYTLLFSSAIVEWVVRSEPTEWSRMGLVQVVVLFIGAIIPPIAFLLNLQMLAPIMLLMLFLFLIVFVIRVGVQALKTNPVNAGVDSWIFFGTFWLIIGVVMFPLELVLQPNPPGWILPVLAHIIFVGMVTNLLFGVVSIRTRTAETVHQYAEPLAMWLINIGLVTFLVLKIAIDIRHGAFLMGAGVLLAVGLMLYRLG